MSVWFFLWLILSGVLLYFLFWTLYILYRQKKAWQRFAAKNKLRYRSAGIFSSPEISGEMDGYTIEMFSGEHVSSDMRRTRKMSAVEIRLASRLPFTGGAASEGMVLVLREQPAQEEIRPRHKGWQDSYMASADAPHVLEEYLTPERLDTIVGLMKIKTAWVILVFKGDIALLRLDTPNPLDNTDKIEGLLKKMLKAARVLEVEEGEEKRLQSVRAKRIKKEKKIDVKEDDLSGGLELELEEDEAVAEEDPPAES